MDGSDWKNGGKVFAHEESGGDAPGGEYWKALLADSSLRSRFIRDLEVQSIGSHSLEDLAQRYRGEEILAKPGGLDRS